MSAGEAPRTGTGRALLSWEPALKTTIIAIEREAASAECQAWMDEGYERPAAPPELDPKRPTLAHKPGDVGAAPPEPPLDVERRNTVERISDQWHALVNRSIAGELSHLEVIQHMNGLLDEATE